MQTDNSSRAGSARSDMLRCLGTIAAGVVLIVGLGSFVDLIPVIRTATTNDELLETVAPVAGVVLPVMWGDLGLRMIEAGVIDPEAFERVYEGRGGLDKRSAQLLYGTEGGALVINRSNAGVILNLLWALGLANASPVLDEGPMNDPDYGGDPGAFASTAGWTLAMGNAMDHYSRHKLVPLTGEQHELVRRVAANIYRPCCGNAADFPDCNHGMAMLGLLELMAAQGVSEEKMYDAALAVNAYWFPDTYTAIAAYLAKQGKAWNTVGPHIVLGDAYSSAEGYRRILAELDSATLGGGSCGV